MANEDVIRDILFKLGGIETSLETVKETMKDHFDKEMHLLEKQDNRIASLEKTRNYLYGTVGTIGLAFAGFTASLWKYIFGV